MRSMTAKNYALTLRREELPLSNKAGSAFYDNVGSVPSVRSTTASGGFPPVCFRAAIDRSGHRLRARSRPNPAAGTAVGASPKRSFASPPAPSVRGGRQTLISRSEADVEVADYAPLHRSSLMPLRCPASSRTLLKPLSASGFRRRARRCRPMQPRSAQPAP